MKRKLLLLSVLLLASSSAWASHQDTKAEIENLKGRIQALETDIGIDPSAKRPFTLTTNNRSLTFSGLVEVEAGYSKSAGEDAISDLKLSTLQLSAEAQVNERVGGHVILLYEEDGANDALKVDEAVITLRAPQHLLNQEASIDLGKMYVPFGKFNSAMISDPLTLDLGETQNSAAVFGLGGDLWSVRVGLFNGEVDSSDDTLDSMVAAFEVTPSEGMSFGVSFLSDIAESGAELVADPALYASAVDAASAYASLTLGDFGMEAEVVTALKDFDAALIGLDSDNDGEPNTDLSGKRPLAWQAQLSYSPTEAIQLAARAEGAEDYQDDVKRYGATISYGLTRGAAIALEYLYSDFTVNPTNQTVIAQLAMEF